MEMNCPKCNGEVDADARYCKHCAFDLSAGTKVNEPVNTQTSAKSNQKTLLVALAIGGFVVLGILVAYVSKSRQVQPASYGAPITTTNRGKTTQVPSDAPQQDPNALTNDRVLAAVQKAFNKLVRSEQMASGASAVVIGVQEIPGANAARADLDLSNAAFLQTDMLSGKWEIGPGGYGGRMVYSKKRIRIDHCTANLKHYTNGKWALESLDTHSYEFGVVTVSVGID
jgi:hypothetical protein